jgi:hypothetical protein
MNHRPDPRHQLREIVDIAHRLLTDWNRFTDTADDLATTGDRLGVHGGDAPDPTLAGMYANQTRTEIELDIGQAWGLLVTVDKRIARITRDHPATARTIDAAVRAARCADPVCTDNAVKDGLCWTHWRATRSA